MNIIISKASEKWYNLRISDDFVKKVEQMEKVIAYVLIFSTVGSDPIKGRYSFVI